ALEPLEARDVPTVALGMNLDRVVDYNPAWMFTDAFKSSRAWQSYSYNTATGALTFGDGGAVATDAHGWPTTLRQWTNAQGQVLQQRLGTMMFDNSDGHYPAGTYQAQWAGSGTVVWNEDARLVARGRNPDGTSYATLQVTPTNHGIGM